MSSHGGAGPAPACILPSVWSAGYLRLRRISPTAPRVSSDKAAGSGIVTVPDAAPVRKFAEPDSSFFFVQAERSNEQIIDLPFLRTMTAPDGIATGPLAAPALQLMNGSTSLEKTGAARPPGREDAEDEAENAT